MFSLLVFYTLFTEQFGSFPHQHQERYETREACLEAFADWVTVFDRYPKAIAEMEIDGCGVRESLHHDSYEWEH